MTEVKKPRGFAAMHPSVRKAISSKGGKVAHQKGVAHEFDTHEARTAGQKGGRATTVKKAALKAAKIDGSTAAPHKKEMVVDVACSSAAGCAGTVKAGSKEAAEAIGKPYDKNAKAPKSSDDQAAADGSTADENPEELGSCGSSGCGSHK